MSQDSPTFSSTHPAHILASLNFSASNNRSHSNGNASRPAQQVAGPSPSASSSSPAQLFFPSGSNQPYYSVDPYATTQVAPGNGTSVASGLSPAASSTGSVRSQHQAGSQAGASGAKAKRKGKEAQGKKSPTAALDGDDDDEGDGGGDKKKRRRRVVVACDTCRRKKVKCRGLPNATSTVSVVREESQEPKIQTERDSLSLDLAVRQLHSIQLQVYLLCRSRSLSRQVRDPRVQS